MSVFLFLATTILGCVIYSLIKSLRRPANYPPGPDFAPWLGNSAQLRKEAVALGGQHVVFEKWAQKYNSNILGLKLGSEFMVVVLSYKLVHHVHLQEVFEGRPDNFFLRLRTMGTRKGITCTDGKLWYQHRNFAMKEMRHVGYGRTLMEQQIEKEANALVSFIAGTQATPIWPGSFLAPSVINVLWSLIAGQAFERDDKRLVMLLDMMNRRSKLFDICGGTLAQFPWMRHIAPERTGYNLICQLNKELHDFFMESIIEHKNGLAQNKADSDLIFAYLKEMQEHSDAENTTFNETQLTMTILDFFIAGSQTTSTTIDLALMMLSLRPDIQRKVYEEAASAPSHDDSETHQVSSRVFSPYMDAFIMEIQRYFHIVPISGPRRALWHTKLAGYDIPRNTTILIGLRSVLMDAEHWGDPETFRPERFIDADMKTIKDEFFIPFGQGRRRCLGDALARACIFAFLNRIVSNFEIKPDEKNLPSVILQPGITLSPKKYHVQFCKRN